MSRTHDALDRLVSLFDYGELQAATAPWDFIDRVIAEIQKLRGELPELRHALKTQDNRATKDPVFLVQAKRRIYGMDPAYCENCVWLDEEGNEIEDGEEPNDTYTGYIDIWEHDQTFLTRQAADAYIDHNSRRHSGDLRVYVDSAYQNPELKAIRAWLIGEET